MSTHYLTALFEPGSVALVGASDNPAKVGGRMLENLVSARFTGRIVLVNPKYQSLRGIPCLPSLDALSEAVDLAVIVTPPATVAGVIEACGRRGIRAAVVITAGFSEAGAVGAALDTGLLDAAHRSGVRVLGPNCLGLMRPPLGLNATFARGNALPGSLALVSQSGAVCTALLDWATPSGIGFSSVISLGGSSDLDFGEVIDYLAADEKTEHILLYIEGVRDARRLVGSLRAAARTKPVILMKVGRHPSGSRAAVSHTGAIVGRDDVFNAVVRRTGVVRVTTAGELVAVAQALGSHVHPTGERLAIVTNGGGPGVMAADRATDLGVALATLAPATVDKLRAALPANWSHGNPVDLIGDAGPERYRAAVAACLEDAGVDGVVAILTPQAMTQADDAAAAVIDAAKASSKPVIACWMGEASVAPARLKLARAGLSVFRLPETAVEAFAYLAAFYRNQRLLLEAPPPLVAAEPPDLLAARRIVAEALAQGRSVLGATESKDFLAAFRIPVARSVNVATAEDAVKASAVSRPHARELMAGIVRDPVFGPAIVFGAGGIAVEVLRDRAVALPPLSATLVADMIEGTRVAKMLDRFRHLPPVDRAALEALLLRVSEIACEMPEVLELDINPIVADEGGALALDARVVVKAVAAGAPRYGHLAIHPYPADLVTRERLGDGAEVTLRPIRPEDAALEMEFVDGLSAESRRNRFQSALRGLTPQMLARFTQIDYDREMALVAVDSSGGVDRQVAVARYIRLPDGRSCEFAIAVADAWQGRGLGRRMMARLIEVARERGIRTMIGWVLAGNHGMLEMVSRLGFEAVPDPDDPQNRRVTLRF